MPRGVSCCHGISGQNETPYMQLGEKKRLVQPKPVPSAWRRTVPARHSGRSADTCRRG